MKTNITTEPISYQTPDGCTIRGVVYKPEHANGTAVICFHQLRLDYTSYASFAEALCERGFLVLTSDVRGHGQSTQKQDQTLSFESMTEDEFRKIPGLDIESAKAFLTQTYKIDPENIGLVGASIGANSVLISSGRNPQTKFVVALSPGLDYRGIQPANEVSQIQKPTFIVTAKGDTYSAASSEELFESIPAKNKNIHVVDSSAHGTELLEDAETAKLVLDWISEVGK